MAEEWKDLMGYEGYYQVSSHGRVRGITRTLPHARQGKQKIKGKILKPSLSHKYLRVVLYRPEVTLWQPLVHTLVLVTFIGLPPTPKHQCNHKDGNGHNNHIDNLEWVTAKENTRHAIETLGRKAPKGEENGHSKLTNSDIVKIRQLYLTGNYTQKNLANMFNICGASMNNIIHRKSWRHIP